jgi:threonine dehydratase
VRRYVSDIVTVSEEEIVEAMRFYWTRMKLVVEPSGAVPLAALLFRAIGAPSERVGLLVTGGNVDLAVACALLGRTPGDDTPKVSR